MARPVWTPTDAQRRQAETMAAYGIPEGGIGGVLGVSKPTLRKHCGTELDTGATRANSKVADFLFYGICGGTGKPAFKDERARVTAAIFWMKTRGGWSETSTHKHTGAANGDPIEVEVVSVRERLTRRIARIAAAKTTGDWRGSDLPQAGRLPLTTRPRAGPTGPRAGKSAIVVVGEDEPGTRVFWVGELLVF